ncbi:MAG: hypothetical protein B6243_09685 [Anaerolineaceae bacterium 4572_5.2]|nr:MAG: hypothetical protein B6243_09685 [Anaerolineaceae bacterium 4572_5.2]
MLAKQSQRYTPQEYLLREAKAEYKSEYHRGEIVALAGASINHNRIARNITTALTNASEAGGCEAFSSDLRVWIKARDRYVYPDVAVTCGEIDFVEGRSDTITNPKIIIEVLSESTESYDRGDKFRAYWALDSLDEYVLVDQYRMRVEYFRQLNERDWFLRVFTKAEEALELKSPGVEIALEQIYRNVTWDE